MKFTCLSKGSGFHFPPHYILDLNGFRILFDCPLDLSALTVYSPLPIYSLRAKWVDRSISDSLEEEGDSQKQLKVKKRLDAKNLIHGVPWYKTSNSLHLWDPSSIDVVFISSEKGMLGLPFLTRTKGFSAKVYVTEATARIGQLMMEDLISMHREFRSFYGAEEGGSPQWMRWEELELLPAAVRQVIVGDDAVELGGWLPLYSHADVEDCMQRIQTLKYAEEVCYNGALVIKAFSSGLEIGSCNWTISSLRGNIVYISSSVCTSDHAMEFDYRSLQGNDYVLYSDFSSLYGLGDAEHNNNHSSPTASTLSSYETNQMELNECLLKNDEISEERQKLAFICSCIVDSVKAGGSVLLPLNRLGVILQLLEQIPGSLESSALKVPIYIVSSVAEELMAFTNIIPEWLCKQRQAKLFSGEPLFLHLDLMKEKKLRVFNAVHHPELLANWQEPCIVFAPHWSLRLGPAVHFLRRWHMDQNSLLVLEDGLNADLALLPFQPMAMNVLQCSFLSGLSLHESQALLKILQPSTLVVPEEMRQHLMTFVPTLKPSSLFYYAENDTVHVPRMVKNADLHIETDVHTSLSSKQVKLDDIAIIRLEGQLLVTHGKYQLQFGAKGSDTSLIRPLLQWGLPNLSKLLTNLSAMGISGSIKQGTGSHESQNVNIINIHDPKEASIEVQATSTKIIAPDQNFANLILEAISPLLHGV